MAPQLGILHDRSENDVSSIFARGIPQPATNLFLTSPEIARGPIPSMAFFPPQPPLRTLNGCACFHSIPYIPSRPGALERWRESSRQLQGQWEAAPWCCSRSRPDPAMGYNQYVFILRIREYHIVAIRMVMSDLYMSNQSTCILYNMYVYIYNMYI